MVLKFNFNCPIAIVKEGNLLFKRFSGFQLYLIPFLIFFKKGREARSADRLLQEKNGTGGFAVHYFVFLS